VTGVFQFEGRSQRYVCSMIKPEKFSEIMDCGALCRPGPLHNGAAREYGEIKQGGKAESRHPALDDILGPTQHQIVYQEQILNIARVIGGFDAAGVGAIRTIIAKKEGEQAFERERERVHQGRRDPPRADRLPEDAESLPTALSATW
jgi:DNA polymerase-3 subunit alpha